MRRSMLPLGLAVMISPGLTGCGESSSSSWRLPLDLFGTGPFVNATVQVMDNADTGEALQVFRSASFDDLHPFPAHLNISNEYTGSPFAYVTAVQDSCIRGAGSRNFVPEPALDLKERVAAGERPVIIVNRYDDCAMTAPALSPR